MNPSLPTVKPHQIARAAEKLGFRDDSPPFTLDLLDFLACATSRVQPPRQHQLCWTSYLY